MSAVSVFAAPASIGDEGSRSGTESLPTDAEFSQALRIAGEEESARAAAREAELSSPKAARERAESREAYAHLTPSESRQLLSDAFPETLKSLAADPARMIGELEIEEVLGKNVARVADGEGGSQLLESPIPIEVAQPGEPKDRLDLSLEPVGSGYGPHQALTPVQLPGTAGGAIQLPSGVAVGLPGSDTAVAQRFGSSDLFFAATDTATDTLLAPLARGVEIFHQLRSVESPEEFRYELSVPAGATLRADGSGGAEVLDAGKNPIAVVRPPSAVDAQGSVVAAELSVEGDSVVVRVEHSSIDVAYPVLLDPLLENVGPATANLAIWTQAGTAPYQLFSSPASFQVRSQPGVTYQPGTFGQFIYQAPGGTAFITSATFNSIFGVLAASCAGEAQPHGYVGIFNVFANNFEPQKFYAPISQAGSNTNITLTPPLAGPGHRLATIGVANANSPAPAVTPNCFHELFVGGAFFFFDDPEAPTLSAPTGPGQPVGNTPLPITISASDPGFGVSTITVQTQGSDGQTKTFTASPGGSCTGLRLAECPHTLTNFSVPYDPTLMPEGSNTLTITARDPAGHVSAAKTVTVVVDRRPDTVIDSAPRSQSPTGQVEFTYSSDNPNASFECRLNLLGPTPGPFKACPKLGFEPSPSLVTGSYRFQVRAVDEVGRVDGTPAQRDFQVDTRPPVVRVVGGPDGLTRENRPRFEFETEGEDAVSCAVEPEPSDAEEVNFKLCKAGPRLGEEFQHRVETALADGAYVFSVLARSEFGHEAVATRAFTVDTLSPDTTIASRPESPTDDARPTFTFSSNEPGSSFRCRFDAEAFGPCSGPGSSHTPSGGLTDGQHTFAVQATDRAGNTDPTPATATFLVNTSAPETTIDAGPAGAVAETGPTFRYSADEPASFQCRVDAATFAACPAGARTLSGLSEGEHLFAVRAIGNGGAIDPTPASRKFIVDVSAPSVPVVSGPVREEGVPGVKVRLVVRDGDASSPQTIRSGVGAIRIKVDGQPFQTLGAQCSLNVCKDTAVREFQFPVAQVIGDHRYVVEGEDGVGHFSPIASWEKSTPAEDVVYTARANGPTDCLAHPIELPKDTNAPGGVLRGTNKSDLIRPREGVKVYRGEGGCDVILSGRGAEQVFGGDGNDLIRAERTNDKVFGGDGNDLIYGGIGDDDQLEGGPGNDLIDGGPGADVLKGNDGNDTLRGGQGEDQFAGGKDDVDTLSYADVVQRGFAVNPEPNFQGFPGTEAGVLIQLNGEHPIGLDVAGGAGDALFIKKQRGRPTNKADIRVPGDFERIVGSAFNDFIEGSAAAEVILGGPGNDVIKGGGGGDQIDGGLGDNFLGGEPTREMASRPAGRIELGVQRPGDKDTAETDLFLSGSPSNEAVTVKYLERSKIVQFVAADEDIAQRLHPFGCKDRPRPTHLIVNCSLGGLDLGVVALEGGDGDDRLKAETKTKEVPGAFALSGGTGTDRVVGGALEELLTDGDGGTTGTEVLRGGGGDDVLFQGEGPDNLQGGPDNDLLISTRICGGDTLFGDAGKGDTGSDNAQFHPLLDIGVFADLDAGLIGRAEQGEGTCGEEKLNTLEEFNDLEGSTAGDNFVGTSTRNLLIGRGGADRLVAEGGNDVINALDEVTDLIINCGGQPLDEAHADIENPPADKGHVKGCPIENEDGVEFKKRPGLRPLEGSDPPVLGPIAEGFHVRPRIAAFFPLDETAGTAAENLVGGVPGTYEVVGVGPSVNSPGAARLGRATALLAEEGSSVEFPGGPGSYVDLGGQGAPGGTDGYSVVLFVKFQAPVGKREYLFSSSEDGEGAFLYRDADGRIAFATGTGAGAPLVASDRPVEDGNWHQLVGTIDGETITLNVDGFPYSLGFGERVMPEPLESPQSLIGAGPGLSDFLTGFVDEVGVYEGALAESEIFAQLAESQAEEPELLLIPPEEAADADGDGVPDGSDNCPELGNSDQVDLDANGIGDACAPPDADGDGIADVDDNCPTAYNPDQEDGNDDGIGDECALLPPTADTDIATNLTGTSATLQGVVNPVGRETSYQFEYGLTTEYGSKAPATAKSVGSGAEDVVVGEQIANLEPGTTYHYRIVATNEIGEAEGEDLTFTTRLPPSVLTGAADAIGETSAGLAGSVESHGLATTYQFEFGTTTAYGGVVPASPKLVDTGSEQVVVTEPLTGLTPLTRYHYRLVATNADGTAKGADRVFTTDGVPPDPSLGAMPITEPFDGSAAAISRFGSDWSRLGWAAESGESAAEGWRPVQAFPTVVGAFYEPVLTDTGSGLAAVATLARNPEIAQRQFALWLDVPDPVGATRAGYQLRFTLTAANTYDLVLSKWTGGAETVLASSSGVPLVDGNSFAIVDQGRRLSAWIDRGAGFERTLSANDGAFERGNAGLEGTGNITRLTGFKVGAPLPAAKSMDAALQALPLRDTLVRTEDPLSDGGTWASLAWTEGRTGKLVASPLSLLGWTPKSEAEISGAFWTVGGVADTGAGTAVSATTVRAPSAFQSRYCSLWLNVPDPATTKSGYELRVADGGFTPGTSVLLTLLKWQDGKATTEVKKQFGRSPNGRFALVEKRGELSVWAATTTGVFTQLLTGADLSFSAGFTGVEGFGSACRLRDFKAGPLPPF